MKRSIFAPLFILAIVFFAAAPVFVAAQTDSASSAPGALPVVPGGEKAMSEPAAAPRPCLQFTVPHHWNRIS